MDKKTINILHVSDLHFGHGNARTKSDQMMIVYEIIKDASRLKENLGEPDIVIISGDIAFKADFENEYSDAKSWITHLCNELELNKLSVLCVPGNHDINRQHICDHPIRKWTHEALRNSPSQLDELAMQSDGLSIIWPKFKNYCAFIEDYGGPEITPQRPFWTIPKQTPLGNISIVGLNSVLLSCDNSDSNNTLLLGQEQIRGGIHDQPEDSLLVVVQHHPPDWLRDGKELVSWLKNRPHILLTGHIHDQGATVQFDLGGGGGLYIAAGAAHTDVGTDHGYSWLTLSNDHINFYPRTWAKSRKCFVPDRNNFDCSSDDGSIEFKMESLPDEIKKWFSKARDIDFTSKETPHNPSSKYLRQEKTLVDNIERLFKLRGYVTKRNVTIVDKLIDLVVEDQNAIRPITYIVHCGEQSQIISLEQFEKFNRFISSTQRQLSSDIQGIIISSVGFSKETELAQKGSIIELYRLSDFEQTIVGFGKYATDISKSFATDSDLAYFVEPTLLKEGRTVSEPALKVIDKWLNDPISNQLTLLGDYGTGKTTLLKYVTLRSVRQYKKDIASGSRARVPVFINLGKYTFARSLKQIILELIDSGKIKADSYAAFEYVLQEGQVLLILDGFDEMASRANLDVTLQNFRELNRKALGRSKIILSCRTHYFHTHRHVQRFLGFSAPSDYTDLYREIAGKPNFLITYLQEFDAPQIEEYLERRCGDRTKDIQSFIQNTYNLKELSRRPVLLDMIVTSSKQLQSKSGTVTPGDLYLSYTDLWLSHNDWQLTIDVDTKTGLLEQIAARLMKKRDSNIRFDEIPSLIRSWNEAITPVDTAAIDRELRTATFLERDDDGNYTFSHRSFLEFFFARFLISSAALDNPAPWDGQNFVREVYLFIRDLVLRRKDCIKILVKWISDSSKSDWIRSNAIKCVAVVKAPEVTDVLLNIVKTYSSSNKVRRVATTALGTQPEKHVSQALINLSESTDESSDVRANALLALGRMGSKNTIDYLGRLLRDHSETGRLHGSQVRAIYLAVSETGDNDLIKECINYARYHIDEKMVLQRCLELIRGIKSLDTELLCEKVLLNTNSPKSAALAVRNLSLEKRKKNVDRIIYLIHWFSNNQYAEDLIKALSGVKEEKVKDFLISIVKYERKKYIFQAFKILSKDYPSSIPAIVPNLIYGKSQEFRYEVARTFYHLKNEGALEFIESQINTGKGVSLRIKLIRLIAKHEPKALAKLITKLWPSLEIPKLVSVALQELIPIDKEATLNLILNFGLNSNRVGIRVISCALLGSMDADHSTNALLKHLEHDDSRWVRLQALRSLLRPGSKTDTNLVMQATEKEPDSEILHIRNDLI